MSFVSNLDPNQQFDLRTVRQWWAIAFPLTSSMAHKANMNERQTCSKFQSFGQTFPSANPLSLSLLVHLTIFKYFKQLSFPARLYLFLFYSTILCFYRVSRQEIIKWNLCAFWLRFANGHSPPPMPTRTFSYSDALPFSASS